MIPHLNLILSANSGALRSGLIQSRQAWDQFTGHLTSGARTLTKSMAGVYASMNGMSAISKLAMAAGGTMLAKDALDINLQFERKLLDMKQTAEMTAAQAASMRQLALDAGSKNLALPTEVADGLQALAAAGMKFEEIKEVIDEATRAAVAFRSESKTMSNMDFDMMQKMGIKPSEIKGAHNLMLYHSKSGRFEATPMAMEAPKYMNAVAHIGVKGFNGLNFTGAMTQILMRLAPATQPSEVSTFIEHGLGHITAKHQVKGLKKFNIDVEKYMPNGKFYGEGGVDGILNLAAEMKTKGLENPFKLDKAGFRELYTRKFWLQLMVHGDEIRKEMANGEKAMLDDMVGRDNAEIQQSNDGKIKKLAIAKEKIQLGETATGAVGKVADLAEWASENPKTAVAGAVAATMAGMYGLNKIKQRVFGNNNPVEKVVDGLGGFGPGKRVFVTNWPDCICGGAGTLKRIEKTGKMPGLQLAKAAAVGTGVAETGAATAGAGTAATFAFGAAMVAVPLALVGLFKKWENSASGMASDHRRYMLELAQMDRRIEAARLAHDTAMIDQLLVQRRALYDKVRATEAKPVAPKPDTTYAHRELTKELAEVESNIEIARRGGAGWLSMLQEQRKNLMAQLANTQGPAQATDTPAKLDAGLPAIMHKLVSWKNRVSELEQQYGKADSGSKGWIKAQRDNTAKMMAGELAQSQPIMQKILADLDQRIATANAKGPDDASAAPEKLKAERDELYRAMQTLVMAINTMVERPIQINLDSKPLVDAVNKSNGRDARRQ
jgi:hypothetical protein